MSRIVGDPAARFWAAVDRQRDHWLWTGTTNGRRDYGRFWDGKRQVLAHRYAYELLVGPIPDDCEIDHKCRVWRCVNPDHLEPVPHRVNVLRGESPAAEHALKTRCPQGHLYDGVDRDGKRFCRTCRRALGRAYYAATQGTGTGSGGANRAKTECAKGHPYDAENTYWRSNGARDCKTCRRERKRK